jgi:serine/threonine protein kinase
MGVVYRAKDPLIGRTVALKTIQLSEEGTGLTHAQLVERFQNETRAAGRLAHPNIVAIYDAGECDGMCYIALELVNGKSLESLLDSGEKFSTPRLVNIMEQVCSALEYAHHQGVLHRDIKPANILLTAGDAVKITDFGTAKMMQYGLTKESTLVGTPGYMSPELIKGHAIDGRTDIFSLGVTLYEMTTGGRPFTGKDVPSILNNILNHEPPSPRDLNPSVPLGISSSIMKALSKSPHLRYESCTELLEDLKNYRPGESAVSAGGALTVKNLASRHAVAESREKSFNASMPTIPGVVPRPASAALPKPTPKLAPPAVVAASTFHGDSREERAEHIPGVYAGPPSRSKFSLDGIKRYARIGAGILVVLWVGNFALKTFSHSSRPDPVAASAPEQVSGPSAPVSAAPDAALAPVFVSAASPQIATLADLSQPWASKSFIYSVSNSRMVPALLIRLPGPASITSSYWAFSLEAPFNQCELQYIQELARLSSEYGVPARHPMVVNPCSHTVFDPLQFKETPGNTFVRGAIVKGSDIRPPYAIEVRVSSNHILATAME